MIWTKKKEKSKAEISLDKVTSKIAEMLRSEDIELFSLGVRLLMTAEEDPVKQDEAIRRNIRRDNIIFKWKVDLFGGERDFEATRPEYYGISAISTGVISVTNVMSYAVSASMASSISALSLYTSV